MKRDFNYVGKDWYEKDVSEEMNTFGVVDIISYFEELEDEETVCTLFCGDNHIESQIENVALIRNAPNMYRLLLQAESHLPPELLDEWVKIQKDLARKLISG